MPLPEKLEGLYGRVRLPAHEGRPHVMGNFLAERLLDDLFLTLSPQIAGRAPEDGRPGLVEGVVFAPKDPRWGTLADVRRGGSHLFLRYSFTAG